MNKLHPLTITTKMKESAEFYVTYFGFSPVFESDWYLQLAHTSGAELAFMLPGLESQPEFLRHELSSAGMVFTLETDDATSEYERLTAAGAPIIHTLTDEEWGQRHFILKDPAGVFVDVVQYL